MVGNEEVVVVFVVRSGGRSGLALLLEQVLRDEAEREALASRK